MGLGVPLMAFSVCVLAGYAEVRPQTKNSPNGFDLVDKSGNTRKPANVRDRSPMSRRQTNTSYLFDY
jgi:hypothetical protein